MVFSFVCRACCLCSRKSLSEVSSYQNPTEGVTRELISPFLCPPTAVHKGGQGLSLLGEVATLRHAGTLLEASDNPFATVAMVHLQARAMRRDPEGRWCDMPNAIFYLTYNGIYNFTNGIGTQTQLLLRGLERLQPALERQYGLIPLHVVCPRPDEATWGYDPQFLQTQQQRPSGPG